VVDNQEIAVQNVTSLFRDPIVFAKSGNRYAFTSWDGMNRNFLAVVDGKQVLPAGLYPNGDSLTFSADGSRYAFVVGPIGRNEVTGLVIDGTLHNHLAVGQHNPYDSSKRTNPYFVLSNDGKHIARVARKPDNSHPGLYVDEKLVYPSPMQIAFVNFTPDSQHLTWIGTEKFPDRPQPYYVVYSDGQAVVKLGGDSFQQTSGSWQMGADGVLTFIAIDGSNVKRFRVTPSPDMTIAKMISNAEAMQAKAIAEANAAKKKAEEEALAKKQKAEADAAAAKAALEKRAADAMKARQDALNAQKLKSLNAQRARQGLPPLKELPQ
jgi:hypothetical protein